MWWSLYSPVELESMWWSSRKKSCQTQMNLGQRKLDLGQRGRRTSPHHGTEWGGALGESLTLISFDVFLALIWGPLTVSGENWMLWGQLTQTENVFEGEGNCSWEFFTLNLWRKTETDTCAADTSVFLNPKVISEGWGECLLWHHRNNQRRHGI